MTEPGEKVVGLVTMIDGDLTFRLDNATTLDDLEFVERFIIPLIGALKQRVSRRM